MRCWNALPWGQAHSSFFYSDEVNTILLYLLGPLNKFSNFIPKKIKIKIEKFLANRFGWYMQIIVKK